MNKEILLAALFAVAISQDTVENMNGEYLIGNPNSGAGGKYSTLYKDRTTKYFDVYSPPI